jgi:hypothetical protein
MKIMERQRRSILGSQDVRDALYQSYSRISWLLQESRGQILTYHSELIDEDSASGVKTLLGIGPLKRFNTKSKPYSKLYGVIAHPLELVLLGKQVESRLPTGPWGSICPIFD